MNFLLSFNVKIILEVCPSTLEPSCLLQWSTTLFILFFRYVFLYGRAVRRACIISL